MRNQNLIQMFLALTTSLLIGFSAGCVLAQKSAGQGKTNRPSSQKETNNEPDAPTLIGKWTSSEARIEFLDESTMTINGDKFKYAVVEKMIIVETDEGQMEFPFTLKGNTLTVLVEGRKVVYTRSSNNGEEEDGPGQNLNRGGSNPQELVGKWCYQANVNANNGGRMSNICFTLYENGTYEYYGETTSSNPYGGSSSQESDAGRWSATATTLSARSNKGETRTFSLEKRNHPKTGDPMLVIDGDAFVTFYQKRPW